MDPRQEFINWVLSLDDPFNSERAKVSLSKIIERARQANLEAEPMVSSEYHANMVSALEAEIDSLRAKLSGAASAGVEVLADLDEMNASGRIAHADYSRLHDAVAALKGEAS